MQDSPPPHDLPMMHRALALADQAAAQGEVPVGAVVYKLINDEPVILGEGHNLRETENDPTAHAEIVAIRSAAQALGTWRLDDCTLVVTLEPCPMCAGTLINARVSRLVYGTKDPKAGCVGSLYDLCTDTRFNHRLTVINGLCAAEASKQLKAFFRARRSMQKPSD